MRTYPRPNQPTGYEALPWFPKKMNAKSFRSDNTQISLMACTAASKLLLLGILPPAATADILRAFVLSYFDPETVHNPALRQALSYFLPVFCHSKLKNALLMAQIAVPVTSKLLLMREDVSDEGDEMVGWPVITAHMADWTDGRKVVGAVAATDVGLDDDKAATISQQAEEPHIYLATDILERTLAHACSKDERKPLLSLLSKLAIASSGPAPIDPEALTTLHELAAEAVQERIGMDATQRNALLKLESNLTKRLGELDVEAAAAAREDTVTTTGGAEDEAASVAGSKAEGGGVVKTEEKDDDEEDDDEDTMMAGVQGEGTRMPLEDDEDDEMDVDEEGSSEVTTRSKGVAVTENDIIDDLLDSEMSE
jgi:condensin complex subunit 3